MTGPLSYSHPLVVAHLPDAGTKVHLVPDAATLRGIAADLGIPGVPEIVADLNVVSDGRGGARVTGSVRGTVTQECVVTLDAFDTPFDEPVDIAFVPPELLPEPEPNEEFELGAADEPDPLVDGRLDLGTVVIEFVALALDPYPRKPGAVFEPPAGADAEPPSPFAMLERLRGTVKPDEE